VEVYMTGNDYFTLHELELLGIAFDVIHAIDSENEDRNDWLIEYQDFCENLNDRAESKCSIQSLKQQLDELMADANAIIDM
jgi:hypothetical protein